MKKLFFFLAVCLMTFKSFSQKDTVLLLNGKELIGNVIGDEVYDIKFKLMSKKGTETLTLDKYRIFSITDSANNELLFYKYDTTIGNFLPENKMRMFVYGERDAQYGFTTPFTSYTGLAVGGASGYFMIQDKNFTFIATPLIYTVLNLFTATRVRKNSVKHHKFIEDPTYLEGYDRVARGKRVTNALKSSLGGMVVGIIVGLAVN